MESEFLVITPKRYVKIVLQRGQEQIELFRLPRSTQFVPDRVIKSRPIDALVGHGKVSEYPLCSSRFIQSVVAIQSLVVVLEVGPKLRTMNPLLIAPADQLRTCRYFSVPCFLGQGIRHNLNEDRDVGFDLREESLEGVVVNLQPSRCEK